MKKLRCQFCGKYCGQRPDEISFRMAKGADVELVATCADCNRSGEDCTPSGGMGLDELFKQFGIKK